MNEKVVDKCKEKGVAEVQRKTTLTFLSGILERFSQKIFLILKKKKNNSTPNTLFVCHRLDLKL